MTVTVQLFAGFRELLDGRETIPVELPTSACVADLLQQLREQHPCCRPLLDRSRVAVNQEFAESSARIDAHSEIALIPPVSGG
ncbi:MAG: MoaD/ThiS family protein [Bacteroidales bacterium]|nr:MoaD/ThiS family protein [Bacteroidales bacterium]